MRGPILVVNAGSSSIKFSGYSISGGLRPSLLFKGQVESIGSAPHMTAQDATGAKIANRRWPTGVRSTHETLFGDLIAWMKEHLNGSQPIAIGHRVVHGGTTFAAATRIDDEVMAKLEALCSLAPLHQPHNLAAIRAITAIAPSLPQVA